MRASLSGLVFLFLFPFFFFPFFFFFFRSFFFLFSPFVVGGSDIGGLVHRRYSLHVRAVYSRVPSVIFSMHPPSLADRKMTPRP